MWDTRDKKNHYTNVKQCYCSVPPLRMEHGFGFIENFLKAMNENCEGVL